MSTITSFPQWLNFHTWKTPRWKCAIARTKISMPMRVALEHGVVSSHHCLLDFGTGRGQDIEHLRKLNVSCVGFDPYWHNYLERLRPTDTVSCLYVINTIEDEIERAEVLQYCWKLAKRVLIIALRTDGKGEGLTKIKTFQKYYCREEFNDFISRTLGVVRVDFPKPGIAFIHKR